MRIRIAVWTSFSKEKQAFVEIQRGEKATSHLLTSRSSYERLITFVNSRNDLVLRPFWSGTGWVAESE